MIQLEVEGVFLDLYDLIPPKLTLAIDSLETFGVQSVYSETFRVPATDHNYNFFKNAFDVNGYDFDVTQKRSARILVSGDEFSRGEIRLNKIFKNNSTSKYDYEIVFFGESRNFATVLGDKKLNQLDLTELNHTLDFSNVEISWNAYPSFAPNLATGLLQGNVLYPLVDFGNTYDSDDVPEQTQIAVGTGLHFTNSTTTVANALKSNRFKPMIRARYLINKIFEEAGFTYESDFIDTPTFYKLYLSAWGNEANIITEPLTNTMEAIINQSIAYNNVSQVPIQYGEEISDDGENFNNNTTYTAPTNGNYTFIITVKGDIDNQGGSIILAVFKNGSVVPGTVQSYSTPGQYTFDYGVTNVVSLNTGDILQVKVTATSNETLTANVGRFKITETPAEISLNFHLDNDYKQIDFLKDIFTKFKLVMVPHKTIPNHFIIQPWSDYIGSGDVIDWTDKLDTNKDVEIEPVFFKQKARVNFEDQEDKDWLNDLNQTQFKENFGTLLLDTNNDLLEGEKKVTTKIAPTPVTQVRGANQNTGGTDADGFDSMVIPHIYSLEPGSNNLLRKPIKPKSRLLWYNGIKNTGLTAATNNTWYYDDDNGSLGFKTQYPQVSPYQYMPNPFESGYVANQTIPIDLNWQNEVGYITFGDYPGRRSVYDVYWRSYIDSIYNAFSRRVTAYFILSSDDLFNFTFNDVIYVEGTYYYVEKINSVPIGQKASVKVELIKLLDYEVPTDGFIPVGEFNIWGIWSDVINLSTDVWNID